MNGAPRVTGKQQAETVEHVLMTCRKYKWGGGMRNEERRVGGNWTEQAALTGGERGQGHGDTTGLWPDPKPGATLNQVTLAVEEGNCNEGWGGITRLRRPLGSTGTRK